MIRILHMIGSLNIGGSQAMVINLHEAIDRTKIQFDYIIDEPTHKALADKVLSLGGRIYEMPKFRGANLFAVKKAWNDFFDRHKEYKILHSHVRSYASLYLPIAKKHGLKTIIHSHSTTNGHGVSAVLKGLLQLPLRYQADYLFACSKKSAQWLYGKNVCKKENFRIIPNCVNIDRFAYSIEHREQIRIKYGINQNDFLVGHVGRFDEVKNHKFLIDVFAEFFKTRKNAKLLLVGEGHLRENIKNYCDELGIADAVIFTGGQTNTAPFYSAMDVFVFPSIWEGVPLAVVEAQAAGLPCLISDTITKDVYLTNLVEYVSLQITAEEWAQKVQEKKNNEKRDKNDSEMNSLLNFDSKNVVKMLQRIYSAIGSE